MSSLNTLVRKFSLWSMKKIPDLELALSHNRRWVVNNQIKNIVLRYPNQTVPVNFLQKKFKTLDLQGKALNWLKKYPCCFEVFRENDELYFRLTKRMMSLVEEEELVKEEQDPVFAERLAKILMMSSNQRLNVVKLGVLNVILVFLMIIYLELFQNILKCSGLLIIVRGKVQWKSSLFHGTPILRFLMLKRQLGRRIQTLASHVCYLQHGLNHGRNFMNSIQLLIFHLTRNHAP